MKKLLKLTIVMSIILALLSGHIAVIAANAGQEDNTAAVSNENETDKATSPGKAEDTLTNEAEQPDAKKDEQSSETDASEKAVKEEDNLEDTTENSKGAEDGIATIAEPQDEGQTRQASAPGRLHVTLNLKLPNNTLSANSFNISLQKTKVAEGENAPYLPVAEATGGNGKIYYEFDNLATDADSEITDYNLRISRTGYQPYNQIVSIKPDMTTTLDITNSFDVNQTTTEQGTVKRAVMGVGDIVTSENDREINDQDIEEMIRLIKSNEIAHDLNGDGKINIIDLSYVAMNKGNKQAQFGDYGYDKIVKVDENTFKQEDTTTAQNTAISTQNGQLEDLFKNNNKFVSVGPKDTTQEISTANPVELTINLGEENKTETEEITIAPSSNPDNNIQSGEAVITYVDAEDADQTMTAQIGKKDGEVIADAATGEKLVAKLAAVESDVSPIATSQNQATVESDGTIVINLGGKVAVKKITIRVTGTKSKKLADIAKVEFLNDMEDRIPAPVIQAPSNLKGEATYESLVIYWDAMPNVTGYEVEIKNSKGEVEYHQADGNQITLLNFHGEEFKDQHYEPFYIRVQSVNGEWKSGFGDGEPLVLTPEPNGPPAPPDNLFVKGGVREVTATWKNMKSTLKYDVEYKKATDTEWISAAQGITANNYTITGLEDKVKYQVRVRGINNYGGDSKGVGEFCTPGEATTTTVEPAILPRYKAINLPTKDAAGNEQEGVLTQHVVSAAHGYREDKGKPVTYMVDSELDEGKPNPTNNTRSALGVVDNTFTSYYQCDDWDDGGSYDDKNANKGVTIELDTEYEMNYITMAQIENLGNILDAKVIYWGNDNVKSNVITASQVITKRDPNGRDYTAIKLPEKIKAKKINIQIGRRYSSTRKITIGEVRLYNYDSLEDDVNGLFKDNMHLELKEAVNETTINELQRRLDTTDLEEYCPADENGNIPEHQGEFNPEKSSIQVELDLAKAILADKDLQDEVVKVDTTVTTAKDGHITFRGGLNAWQPLGVVAASNETIKVYVGNPNKKIGDSTNIRIVPTQYHAEAAYWKGQERTLRVGVNEISIPQIITSAKEKGGALYVEYTGNNPAEEYAVRVSGGEKIPVLDLSKAKYDRTDDAGRKAAVEKYVGEIEKQVENLQKNHDENHTKVEELNYDYDPSKEEDCIGGATDIVLDQMMYSVSSRQILEGLKENESEGSNADKLYESLKAMEDVVDLFYAHKGLSKDANAGATNQYPASRLNIRYHIMFAGAAMYAGGQHIGIPYGDVKTLAKGHQIQMENGNKGKYVSGNYFGWGISHEIGHIINESCYVHGEVTNNYFSVLSQAADNNDTVRFQYPEVYKKVTSGKTGKAQNVFTQLGLYWQFHLANDLGGYNFETFDNYQDQFDNLVFSRMDTYAREYAKSKTTSAPKAGDEGVESPEGALPVELTLGDSKDDNLMRLACAATKHNVLNFFVKWGMIPDDETIRYASQFKTIKEDRNADKDKAIWYINDNARTYQLDQKPAMTEGTKVEATVSAGEQKNQKVITLGTTGNSEADAILGYEIKRISWAYGDEIETPVGFITTEELAKTGGKYTDTIDTINNRVFEYRITAYDKYLNSTDEFKSEQFKIEHDGNVGKKSEWEISTNFLTSEEQEAQNEKNNPANQNNAKKSDCSASENETNGEVDPISAKNLIDNIYNVDYEASAPKGQDGEITITLPEETNLTGLRYKTASNKEIADLNISVSTDGTTWENVTQDKTGLISRIFNTKLTDGSYTAYFNPNGGDELCVYPARYVKITTSDDNIAISEIDLIGQTGDNIDFTKDADGKYQGIGILENEVPLGNDGEGNDVSIPAGSIVFTGTYKGNPAYNTPVVYDNEGNPIDAEGAVFADPISNEQDKLGEVNEGIWIFWVKPDAENFEKVKALDSVRAELYRTDDAITLYGERLTSDTYLVKVPRNEDGSLPKVRIDSDKTQRN